MHKHFGEWYRVGALNLDGEVLKKRAAVIDAYEHNRTGVASLVHLAFGDSVDPKFEEAFRLKFHAADPTFRMKDNANELEVLAAASLIELIDNAEPDFDELALLAATGSLVADFRGCRRKRCIVPELLSTAVNYLDGQTKDRASWSILNEAAETADDITEYRDALLAVADETNILWWVFGETSRDSQRKFSSYEVAELSFVAGKELSDLALSRSGAFAVAAILNRILSFGKGDASRLVPFPDLITAIAGAGLPASGGTPDQTGNVSIVGSALRAKVELGASWHKKIQTAFGIKSEKLSASQLAEQVYLEHRWDKAWQRCT